MAKKRAEVARFAGSSGLLNGPQFRRSSDPVRYKQPQTRATGRTWSPHASYGWLLYHTGVRLASRMSKTLVPNAGLKRWPHSLAGAAEPMADHHPSGSNPESPQYDAVGFTERLLWQPWFEPGPAPISAIARACPNPFGGEILGLKSGTWCLPFVCVCVCVWKFFMRFLVFLLFLSDILRDKDSLSIMRGVSSTPAVGACRRLEHQHDCQ